MPCLRNIRALILQVRLISRWKAAEPTSDCCKEIIYKTGQEVNSKTNQKACSEACQETRQETRQEKARSP